MLKGITAAEDDYLQREANAPEDTAILPLAHPSHWQL